MEIILLIDETFSVYIQTESDYIQVTMNTPLHPRPLSRSRGNVQLDKMKDVYDERTIGNTPKRQPTWPLRKPRRREHREEQKTVSPRKFSMHIIVS